MADQDGEVTLDVVTDASYHMFWCGYGVGSNACLYSGYTSEGSYSLVGKYCADEDIIPEIERTAFRYLPNGNYLNIGISLAEEGFHQNCGTWRTILKGALSFEVYGNPPPTPELPVPGCASTSLRSELKYQAGIVQEERSLRVVLDKPCLIVYSCKRRR